jgi:hypothetical protein
MFELTFLHQALLWGTAAIAAPILVHLVLRQTPRLAPFPALRFVRASRQASLRRHRLKHLLLLLLRAMLLVLLATALARPVLQSDFFSANPGTPIAAAFLFDDSYSMDYEFHGRSRLDEAKARALDILDTLPPQSEAVVLTTSHPKADALTGLDAARRRIRDLRTTQVPSVCHAGLDRACDLLVKSAAPKRREVYLFTDMTAVGWRGLESLTPRTQKDVGLYVIDVGVEEDRNVALQRLAVSRAVVSENVPLRVTATLSAGDFAGRRFLEFFTDGDVKRGQQEVVLQKGQTIQAHFDTAFVTSGVHQGRVTIRERDALAADNAAFFTVTVREAPRVLVVNGHGGAQESSSAAFFLVTALDPPAFRRERRQIVRPDVLAPSAVAQARLADYGAVFLADVPSLPPAAWARLGEYVDQGGGLAVFTGPHVDGANYAGLAARDLMPGAPGAPTAPAGGVSFALRDFEHPLLARFADGANGDLAAPLFTHYTPLTDLRPQATVVLRFTDQAPAVLEYERGRGRVVFFAFAANVDWTDFPGGQNPAFPVLMQEVVRRLGGFVQEGRNFVMGQTVRLALAPDERRAVLTGFAPDRAEPVPLLPEPNGQTVVFPAPRAVGNYRVELRQEGQRTTTGFSVNPWTEESRRERIDPSAVAERFPPGAVVFARSADELQRAFTRIRVGKELFPYLLFFLLLVFVGESYLANRFYRKDGPAGANKERRTGTADERG